MATFGFDRSSGAKKPRPHSMIHYHRELSLGTQKSTVVHRQHDLEDQEGDAELRLQQALFKTPNGSSFNGVLDNHSKRKTGFNWLWQKSGILGNWMNKSETKPGLEPFWPAPLDQECDKCSRILFTFTHGDLDPKNLLDTTRPAPCSSPKAPGPVRMIPAEVIQQSSGLVIFTVFRTDFGWSAASGSGVVVARDSPTSWGPPSGILINASGLGFLAGVDVYEVVLVLRTEAAVVAFGKSKLLLGTDLAVVTGPVGNNPSVGSESEASLVFSYTKSKGIHGGLQLHGAVIVEREDENARFYSRKIKAEQILKGGAVVLPRPASGLITTVEAAEGKIIDPDELPDDVHVAPSNQSGGVSTILQSRQKAKEQLGTDLEKLQESKPQPRQLSKLSDAERIARRRTLPPLSYNFPPPLTENSRKIRVGSRWDIMEERDQSRFSFTSKPPPTPPPRSSARQAPTPQMSPTLSAENISMPPTPSSALSSRQSDDIHASRLSRSSVTPEHVQGDDLVMTSLEKAPEPFQLHSRVSSIATISIPFAGDETTKMSSPHIPQD